MNGTEDTADGINSFEKITIQKSHGETIDSH